MAATLDDLNAALAPYWQGGGEGATYSPGGSGTWTDPQGNAWSIYAWIAYLWGSPGYVPPADTLAIMQAAGVRPATAQEYQAALVPDPSGGSDLSNIALGLAFVAAPWAITTLAPVLGSVGASAAVGAGKALVTGGNPLIGAVTGGAFNTISDLLPGPIDSITPTVGDIPTVFDAPGSYSVDALNAATAAATAATAPVPAATVGDIPTVFDAPGSYSVDALNAATAAASAAVSVDPASYGGQLAAAGGTPDQISYLASNGYSLADAKLWLLAQNDPYAYSLTVAGGTPDQISYLASNGYSLADAKLWLLAQNDPYAYALTAAGATPDQIAYLQGNGYSLADAKLWIAAQNADYFGATVGDIPTVFDPPGSYSVDALDAATAAARLATAGGGLDALTAAVTGTATTAAVTTAATVGGSSLFDRLLNTIVGAGTGAIVNSLTHPTPPATPTPPTNPPVTGNPIFGGGTGGLILLAVGAYFLYEAG